MSFLVENTSPCHAEIVTLSYPFIQPSCRFATRTQSKAVRATPRSKRPSNSRPPSGGAPSDRQPADRRAAARQTTVESPPAASDA